MDDFEKELKVGFLEEAAQSVEDVEQCFLALESDPTNQENLNKIFRLAHNLKGSSKAVGFDDFGAFTHQFESFILRVKNGELKTSQKVINLLLRVNDHVSMMIGGLKENLGARFESTDLLNEMRDFLVDAEEEPSLKESVPGEEVSLMQAPTQSILDQIMDSTVSKLVAIDAVAVTAPAALAPVVEAVPGEAVEAVDLDVPDGSSADWLIPQESHPEGLAEKKIENKVEVKALTPKDESDSSAPKNPPSASVSGSVDESIRVGLSKVESLINFVGELVILQSVIREQATNRNAEDFTLLGKTITQMGKVGKEIQDIALGMRMIPVKPSFLKMQRIVRDSSKALNKEVKFSSHGEDTELDKTVLERINDPLVHLVRNSVDHGIEPADVRISRGKNPVGHVELQAYHSSGKLVLEVRDDGGGLDPVKLKSKAIEKGILKPGAELSDREAYNLVFAPGFSTKEKVTDISGRGVGMDVVRTNILELGGEVQIESTLHVGTTFRLVLPLTLAIVDAMVISYSNERFVLPMNHLHETIRPTNTMIQKTDGLGEILMLRDENIPITRLGDFFSLKNSTPTCDMIALVIKSGSHPVALLVDDILGQYQVVIKRLGKELNGVKGVSGTTILGDGRPALILEPQDLFKRKVVSSYVPSNNIKLVGGKTA